MKQTLLVVLGGGGHSTQMNRLVQLLGDTYDYEYVAAYGDANVPMGAYRVLNPREKKDRNWLWITCKLAVASVQSIGVLFRTKASIIIACGPAVSVPVCILSKLFRKKVIYVESWSRVRTRSLSARLTRPFADLFFVQSSQLKAPGAVFAGRLG